MKKNWFILISFLMILISCSQEDELNTSIDTKENSAKQRSVQSANGKYKTLGFGYDVTGAYLAEESTRGVVLDIDKIENELKYVIIYNSQTKGRADYYYGYSAFDYISDITNKSNFTASVKNAELTKDSTKVFGGNITNDIEFSYKYTYSSKYSFASADITRSIAHIYLNAETYELSKYVTDRFLNDLNTLTPDRFVERYGTHVLTDINLGGTLRLIYRSIITEETNFTNKKNVVKAGLNATIKGINIAVDQTVDQSNSTTLNKYNTERNFYIRYSAGQGLDKSYDLEKGELTGVNLGEWEKSINNQNAGLTTINWKETYPIYEFIKDPNKKAEIKAAVQNYIDRKQLEMIEIVPLYHYYHDKHRNDHYTISADKNKYSGMGYRYVGVEGYIYPKQEKGTVALHHYYHDKDKNDNYTISTDKQKYLNWGFRYIGIEGYIYPKQEEGTIPLYHYYHDKDKDDHFTTSDDRLKLFNWGYRYIGIEGYVRP